MAASRIVPTLDRLSWIVAVFVPVVPDVLTATFHVADGAPPLAVAELIDGAVPPVPLVTSAKLPVVTLLTGSLKVTVQFTGVAFVGFASARLIDVTVGTAVSYV